MIFYFYDWGNRLGLTTERQRKICSHQVAIICKRQDTSVDIEPVAAGVTVSVTSIIYELEIN